MKKNSAKHAIVMQDARALSRSDPKVTAALGSAPPPPTAPFFPATYLAPLAAPAAAQGAAVVKVPLTAARSFDVAAIAGCGAAIFFLPNPTAPLGVAFPAEQVEALARAFPGLLVVDEASAAFAAGDCV